MIHKAGLPTDIDVRTLREKYPWEELNEGDIIPYSDIEKLLGVNKHSNRFTTVTNKWRGAILYETNTVIGAERGVGFKILDNAEKVDLTGLKLKAAESALRKSQLFGSKIDTSRISDVDKARLHSFTSVAAKTVAMLQIKSKLQLPEMS